MIRRLLTLLVALAAQTLLAAVRGLTTCSLVNRQPVITLFILVHAAGLSCGAEEGFTVHQTHRAPIPDCIAIKSAQGDDLYFSKVPDLTFNELKLVKRVIRTDMLFDNAKGEWEVDKRDAVEIHLNQAGASKLAAYTSHSDPKSVALRINGELFSEGVLFPEINDGVIILTGKIEEKHFKQLQKLVR